MRSKLKLEAEEHDDNHDIEILKAAAQAWYGHSAGSSRITANEFDALRLNFKGKPTRFKLEAMNKPKDVVPNHGVHWDFGQSLLDSYEIVSLSKKLETGLVMDHELENMRLSRKRRKESKNSLRNLFGRMSSSRSSDAD